MKLDELKEHCLKTLKLTEKFPTKTFEEHALVLLLIENQESIISELEKIKIKIENLFEVEEVNGCVYEKSDVYCDDVIEILDNEISKLKGENKE